MKTYKNKNNFKFNTLYSFIHLLSCLMVKISPQLWSSLIDDHITHENRGDVVSKQYIIDKYGVSRYIADFYIFAIQNRNVIHNDVATDLSKRKLEAKTRSLEKQNKQIMEELDKANSRLDFLLEISSDPEYKFKEYKINVKESENTLEVSEAVAFAMLSDIHIEERVDLEMMEGMNEYNVSIATKRVENFFKNLLKLVDKERQAVEIDTLVLGLLGDNITGYIHEDLKESNYLSPTEATMVVKDILVNGIKYLADNGGFKKIIIPCTAGNHGRTTKFKRFATGYKNSYEWMMYCDMKKIFEYQGDAYSHIEFIIPKSEILHVKIYDKMIRFGHGDHFNYGGGIGGITIPLKKWLHRMNEQTKADMTFLGHWHNILTEVTEDCMLNGSVIGMNSYSKQFGGQNRPPQQIFAILDKRRGFTIRTHIDCKE